MPNNNSSIQAIRLSDGRLALAFNAASAADATDRRLSLYDDLEDEAPAQAPSRTGRSAFWGAPRAPMTLAFSSDDGRTWPVRRDVETGDGYCMTNNSKDGLNRELSYPSLTELEASGMPAASAQFLFDGRARAAAEEEVRRVAETGGQLSATAIPVRRRSMALRPKPMPRRATIPQATAVERYRSTVAMDGFVTRTRSLQRTTRATSRAEEVRLWRQ